MDIDEDGTIFVPRKPGKPALLEMIGDDGKTASQRRIEKLETALRAIAEDPCLDPEGNAEIARAALSP